MNYYIFNNGSRASHYGIGTYVHQLTNALSKVSNYRIYHVELQTDVKEFTIEKDEQGIVHYLFPELHYPLETTAFCRNVCHILNKFIDPHEQNIFQFNYFHHYQIALALKAKFVRSRIILTIHYFNWCFQLKGNLVQFRKIVHASSEEGDNKIKKEVEQEKAFMHLADKVIVLSTFCRELLITDYAITPEKLCLIQNGLGESSTKSPIMTTFSKNLATSIGKYILFVGRLDIIKGIEYMFNAFSQVTALHKDIKLVVIGNGNYDECLKHCKGIWHKIVFTGHIPHAEISKFYENALLGILPSFHEQCSYSAIEFMKHGIPMIGTDTTGLKEMITHHDAMVHIDEKNFTAEEFTNQLAEKINKLLDDEKLRKKIVATQTELYFKHYTAAKMGQDTKILADTCLNLTDIVTEDMLTDIDYHMLGMIHRQPDIDTSFYGMAGIGVYLWWRMNHLNKVRQEEHFYHIAEYMIYYIDWYFENIQQENATSCHEEMAIALQQMQQRGFYKTRISELCHLLHINSTPTQIPKLNKEYIVSNALKIFNTRT